MILELRLSQTAGSVFVNVSSAGLKPNSLPPRHQAAVIPCPFPKDH